MMTFKSTGGTQGSLKATSSDRIDISAPNCMYLKNKGYHRIKEKQSYVNISKIR